jgi:hypothetical protein
MNSSVKIWLALRILRWLCWGAFLVVSGLYIADPAAHLNSFGHLTPRMEMLMFGTSLLAVFVGHIEMMARERAGLSTPSLTQLVPPKADNRALVR